ncbi:hypothetical protein [Pantoea sp. KPR_PJ]|uniref:hypothetical protein n=1 Tax=Pantoea sp. KPR_PJ TaxID=2738375 RepID=UPI00352802B9
MKQDEALLQQSALFAGVEKTGFHARIKVTLFMSVFSDITALRNALSRHCGNPLTASAVVEIDQLFISFEKRNGSHANAPGQSVSMLLQKVINPLVMLMQ